MYSFHLFRETRIIRGDQLKDRKKSKGLTYSPLLIVYGKIKKVKANEKTSINTFWLTASFVLITWSIAVLSSAGIY